MNPDTKTTVGGVLLALGMVATKASTFGLPQWVDFIGACTAAIGGALLGRYAAGVAEQKK